MATLQHESGRVPVYAVGLVEWDEQIPPRSRDNRLRYGGTVYQPGQRTDIAVEDVAALSEAGQVQALRDLPDVDWFGAPGRILQCEPGTAHVMAATPQADSLRIVQGTGYDPGNAAYRFHTAVNEYTPHASAFVRYMNERNNPFDCPWQYDAREQMPVVRSLLLSADVVHCHIDTRLTQNAGMPRRPRKGQVVVKHYHGTQFNGRGQQEPDEDQVPVVNATQDDMDGFVLVGARLTLCALRPGRIQWLPITVPVDRYAAMVPRERVPGPFRVSHSPTKSLIKGTAAFLEACDRLNARGVAVEPVLIEGKTHAEALRLRATADATFDSFALGIQGSGLEAAAMGQPVIAGDSAVADLYRDHIGYVPYTFANDASALEAIVERLATDAAFRVAEAVRVHDYCRRVHDYKAVAVRYHEILTNAGARRLD